MNRMIFTIFIVFLFNAILTGQLEYTKFHDIMPFTQMEKYKDQFEINELPSYKIPNFNNDSLKEIYPEVGESFVCCITCDTSKIYFVKEGSKFRIKEGVIWLFLIESSTAASIAVDLEIQDLYPGSYIGFYSADWPNVIDDNSFYGYEDIDDYIKSEGLIFQSILGSKMVIEYFIPKHHKANKNMFIKRISYGFRVF